jgi:hypothetical protein
VDHRVRLRDLAEHLGDDRLGPLHRRGLGLVVVEAADRVEVHPRLRRAVGDDRLDGHTPADGVLDGEPQRGPRAR